MFNNENDEDIYKQIDTYMQESEIRKRMDNGNWSALMKGSKQVYNSIPHQNISVGAKIDDVLARWLAEVYVFIQWKYSLPSAYIDEKLPANTLAELYYPLHEISIEKACNKLYEGRLND